MRRGAAALLAALADQGVEAHGRSGMNVWVLVREEAPVLAALSDAGLARPTGARASGSRPPPGSG